MLMTSKLRSGDVRPMVRFDFLILIHGTQKIKCNKTKI